MAGNICVDCRECEASLHVRNRYLCTRCFLLYINTKVHKRMESYRFKYLAEDDEKRRLFVPLSGGVSSLVLLQVLDAQLQRQVAVRNRTAYEIVVVRVLLPHEQDQDVAAAVKVDYERVARRYPLHTFLPLLSLEDVWSLDVDIEQDLGKGIGLERQSGELDNNKALLLRMLSCTTSATARSDLQSILLRRLLVRVAKDQKCESILWGHSDSRLAALALADVAKGRGGSVPSTIADGLSMHGINFNYPLRDLFKAELQSYAQAVSNPVLQAAVEADTATQPLHTLRDTSIDSLLGNYIYSQGEKYPGIMANVVRTAGKLQARKPDAGVIACSICIMPIEGRQRRLDEDSFLCYGCERMKQDIKF